MKKLILMAAMMLFAFSAKAEDKVTAKVNGTTLNIGLENTSSFVAFQMDITLPTGVTASDVQAVASRLGQTNNGGVANGAIGDTKFIVAYNTLEGNILRVIAYNLANAAISGNSGDDILTITLSAAVSDPTKIEVNNIKFVTVDDLNAFTEVEFSEATGENGGLLGDADGNGKVEMPDAILIMKYILVDGDTTKLPKAIKLDNANVNKDTKVDLVDAIAILKSLL